MRKVLLLTVFIGLVSSFALKAQSTFFNLYGTAVGDEGWQVVEIPGGGYAVAGLTDEVGFGMKDAAVWRVNANGTLAWCRKIGTGNVDWTLDITAISPGGFYVAIRSVDPNNWRRLNINHQTGRRWKYSLDEEIYTFAIRSCVQSAIDIQRRIRYAYNGGFRKL